MLTEKSLEKEVEIGGLLAPILDEQIPLPSTLPDLQFALVKDNKAQVERIVTKGDLGQLSGIPPRLRDWLECRYGNRLDLIAGSLIEMGVADDGFSALAYLVEHFGEIEREMVPLEVPTAFHLSKRVNDYPWKKLRKVVGKKGEIGVEAFYRLSGSHGHGLILASLTGGRLDYANGKDTMVQLPLPEENSQLPLLFPAATAPNLTDKEKVFNGNTVREEYLLETQQLIDQVVAVAGSETRLYLGGLKVDGYLTDLYRQMYPLVGGRIENLRRYGASIENREHIIRLGLVGWARGLVGEMLLEKDFSRHNEMVFCREVRDLDGLYGVRGGRIDLVRFFPKDGSLTGRQRQVLTEFRARRFSSLAQAVKDLGVLGRDLSGLALIIEDYKMWVGDSPCGDQPNWAEEVAQGVDEEALAQLTLSSARLLANWCALHDWKAVPDRLLANNPFQQARIKYVQPGAVIVHDVDISPDGQESYLRKIATSWSRAEALAEMEGLDNAMVNYVTSLRRGRFSGGVNGYSNGTGRGDIVFRWKQIPENPLIEIIRSFRHYYDPETKIIEVIGQKKNGDPLYRIDVNQLIRLGRLPRVVDLRGNVLVNCVFHNERTGSLALFPDGRFKCFGKNCGKSGRWTHDATDPNLTIKIDSQAYQLNGRARQTDTREKLVAPKRLHEIISLAQQIACETLDGKEGQAARDYFSKRKIHLSVAKELGVGVVGKNLLPQLIDKGCSFQELKESGYVTFSRRVPDELISYFLSCGVDVEELREKKEDNPYYVYACSALEGRLVVPLGFPMGRDSQSGELIMRWTNMYGRAIWPTEDKKKYHRKLKVKKIDGQKIPQGGFNMQALGLNVPIIRVVEGLFDALSWYQKGLVATMALIGTANEGIEHSLREYGVDQYGKIPLWGLDYEPLDKDLGGAERTQRLMKIFPGSLNFTEAAVRRIPRFGNYKDPNEWLKDEGDNIDLRAFLASDEDELMFYELLH